MAENQTSGELPPGHRQVGDTSAEVLCNRCNKTDNHPKVHVLGTWVKDPNADEIVVVRNPNFHHDCIPDEWAARYEGDPTHARMMELRRAAIEDGLRGDALRAHNATLEDDNDPAIAEAYAASLEEG